MFYLDDTEQLWTVTLSLADDGSEVLLKKGEVVKVIRASEKRGYLVVEHKSSTLHLPFQVMELKVRSLSFLPLLRNVSPSLSCRRGSFFPRACVFTRAPATRASLVRSTIWETGEAVNSLGYSS